MRGQTLNERSELEMSNDQQLAAETKEKKNNWKHPQSGDKVRLRGWLSARGRTLLVPLLLKTEPGCLSEIWSCCVCHCT